MENLKYLIESGKSIDNVVGELKESPFSLLNQSNLSSSEYQKAKKLKGFKEEDYKWDNRQDLYVKLSNVKESYGPSYVAKGEIYMASEVGGNPKDTDKVEILKSQRDSSGMYNVEVKYLSGSSKGKTDKWYLDKDDKIFTDIKESKRRPMRKTVKEAKLEHQDKAKFSIGYENMGGGLVGDVFMAPNTEDKVVLQLGHYSGGRDISIELKGDFIEKILKANKKMDDIQFDNFKRGGVLKGKDLEEYFRLQSFIAMQLTQNIALDLRDVASKYEAEIKKVLKKYGAK